MRELQNAMARVAATVRSGTLSAKHVNGLLEDAPIVASRFEISGEENRVREALERSGGRVAIAAERLGISRVTLWRRMRQMQVRG